MTTETKIILDAHTDILLDVLLLRSKGEKSVLQKRLLPQLRAARINAVVCSLFIEEYLVPEGALRNALDQISALKADLEESPAFVLCRNAEECRKAAEEGRISLFLSLEGAEPLGRDPLLLRIFHELGVRLLGLAWSRRNYACDGVSFLERPACSAEGGLTDFGRELVREAHSLGIVLDVSHLNDAGFRELAAMSEVPFIASHSNCRSLCSTPRNLPDDFLELLAARGGVTGMNAYGPFVDGRYEKRKAEALFAHLDHVLEVAGPEHAGIGLDLCGWLFSLKSEYEMSEDRDIFEDYHDAGRNFISRISARYGEEIADALLGENFMRVFERVMR